MPYPFDSGAVAPGTSLGVHVASGGNEPGLYSRLTGQIVLEDARQNFISGHAAHTDIPGHNFTALNQYGEVTSWPTIVPMNDGWFSLQRCDFAEVPDAHWSGITRTSWRGVALDLNGNILWQKEWTPAEIGSAQIEAPTYAVPAGKYADVVAIAGNNASRVLILIRDSLANTSTYKHLDFDSSGNFTATTAFTDVYYNPYSWHYSMRQQIVVSGGILAFSNRDVGTGRKIMGLDSNLNLIGSLSIPAGVWNKSIVNGWQGTDGPVLIDTTGTNTWKATPIVFDGVSAPTFGTPYTGDAGTEIVFASIRTHGFMAINNWNVGNIYPKPTDYWIAPDGTPTTVAPNAENTEMVFDNQWTGADVSAVAFEPTIGTDWYGRHAGDSPYNGDRWGTTNYVVRINVGDVEGAKAGWVDLILQYPEAPSQAYTGYTGYGDVDMDEAGYAIANSYNDRVLISTYHYWTELSTGTGWEHGENRLTSFFVFKAGDAPAPPTVPGWVNVFGSTTGGTTTGGNGPCIDCGRLGTGTHRAFLYDRGGARKIAEITDITTLRWSRIRDDISEATVIVNSPPPQCCAILANIAVGRHEIVIFRDQDRVWEGPITRVNWKATAVEITAADVCHYLSRTIMHNAYDNRWAKTGSKVGPVTHRAQAILANELKRKEALSTPINVLRFLDVRTDAATTKTSRFTYPYQSSVWEEIDYMAQRLSLDYTTIGRRIVIFDTHAVLSRLQMLTDKDFTDELIVSSYGMELATVSAVTDGEGHWASVGGIDDFYGEVELLNTTYGEGVKPANPTAPTKAELAALASEMTSQAQRNLSGRYPIPTVVRVPDGTQLDPSAPVCINELVPGVRIPIRSTLACLTLEQEQKLDKVQVEQTPDGETVSITLSPAPGTTPWDDSSDTSPGNDGTTAE